MNRQDNQRNDGLRSPQILRVGGRGGGPMAGRMNAEKPKSARKSAVRLIRYIGKSSTVLGVLIVIMLLVTFGELMGPYFQAKAIDTITLEEGHLTVDMASLRFYLVTMAVVFACCATLSFFQSLLSARLSQRTVRMMRRDLFRKISGLSIGFTDSHKHGDLMSRMTNDVEHISNAISQSITTLFSCVLTLIGAAVMMLRFSLVLTGIALLTIPVSIFVSSTLAKFMRKYFVRQQKLLGQLNGQVEEMVTSYKTVVSYGKEPEAVEKFSEISGNLRTCAVKAKVWGSVMGPIMNFIGNLQYVLIAATGGWLMINRGKSFGGWLIRRELSIISIGSIQAMLQYSRKFTHPINMIANQYSGILTALAGAERIFEIMDAEDEIDEGTNRDLLPVMRGDVEFSDVRFGYFPTKIVLKGLNLSVHPGQKVALVGATGSGKTTIVNLLTRFYEPNSGSITIDGVDIRTIPKADLRHSIAIVLQDTVLFSDTIRNNIKYGHPEASDEAMIAAAVTAKADLFINRLPDGYDTMLTEAGSNLSQGQRQLLAIARAVLANPKILILDEATSNVDTRTEMHIQQAMAALMKNRTSLIIAHRLSTIRDADLIAVIANGTVAESGNHDQLLRLGGEYSKLYSNQFAGIET